MTQTWRTQAIESVLDHYLTLGDRMRVAALPRWFNADISLSQLKALFVLAYYGPLTVSELARRLELGNPAASLLVQKLVQAGLVRRSEDADDRRRAIVRLTAIGNRLVAARREHIQQNLGRWLAVLADDDLAALERGLSALAQIMAAEPAEQAAAEPVESHA